MDRQSGVSQSEQLVSIAARMYQCREQAIYIQGEEQFRTSVAKWQPVFELVMQRDKCNVIQALSKLLQRAKDSDQEGLLMHILTAVACELAEPTVTRSNAAPA